ncbi:MAG TPA: glycosyltransferase family 39 protein [Solirubrobacteraceae bacterium]|nr:glycosyltransferase family 39 protein [Solirubrobacteraceae bacterium]
MLRGSIVTLALAALLFAYAASAQLGGDEMFHLVWGSDILHGRTPDLESSVAPTMHPLELLVAVPAAALGRLGDDAMRIVALLGLVATAAALYRIGTRLFSRAVGVVAALLFVTRPHLLEMAHHAEPDVLAVAAIAWAAVVALEWPHRRTIVLALLAVAGLLRPEAWLLALAYAAWQARGKARREQAQLALLALAGPALWALTDLLLTGDPLLSFLRTRDRTTLLARETGLPAALDLLPHHLGFLLGLPILLVGVLGFVAGLWYATRRAAPPAAAAIGFGAAFVALGIAGLSLQPRYLVGLSAVICLFAAIGALGWRSLRPGSRGRTAWQVAGILGVIVLLVGIPWDLRKHDQVRTALLDQSAKLDELTRGDVATALKRCRPIQAGSARAIPHLAYWIGVAPTEIVVGTGGAHALVTPTATTDAYLAGHPPIVITPPAGMRRLAANEAWQAYVAC